MNNIRRELEVISAVQIACGGQGEEKYEPASKNTVDAIITTFRDGTARVSCIRSIMFPMGHVRCAAEHVKIRQLEHLPYCPFEHPNGEDKK